MSFTFLHRVFCVCMSWISFFVHIFFFIHPKCFIIWSSFHSYSFRIFLLYFDRWLLFFERIQHHSLLMFSLAHILQPLPSCLFILRCTMALFSMCSTFNTFTFILSLSHSFPAFRIFVFKYFNFPSHLSHCPRHIVDYIQCIYAMLFFTNSHAIKSNVLKLYSFRLVLNGKLWQKIFKSALNEYSGDIFSYLERIWKNYSKTIPFDVLGLFSEIFMWKIRFHSKSTSEMITISWQILFIFFKIRNWLIFPGLQINAFLTNISSWCDDPLELV